jgi:selT/selW/selH-like putative selenoprotein
LAAELESQFSEDSELIKSSGGVFEIEDRGELIFSKSKLGRFPEDDEIAKIIHLTASGTPLSEAQKAAAESAHGVSFADWLMGILHLKSQKNT